MTPSDEAPSGRMEEFQREINNVKVKSGSASLERQLLGLGILLALAGIVVVIVGWYGASGTAVLSDQIPYVISGGMLGIALTTIGAALYVRHSLSRYLQYWLIRLVYEQREQTDRTIEALAKIEERLGSRS